MPSTNKDKPFDFIQIITTIIYFTYFFILKKFCETLSLHKNCQKYPLVRLINC